MYLDFIEAHNFRNLAGKITWGRRLNIIHGSNGQGKTNWLEAIYLLARSKSFRTQRLQEAIKFGGELAVVKGQVVGGNDVRRDLRVTLQGNTKWISVNEKREPLHRYLSQLQVFAFTADELEVVRGVPEARRRFIDRGISSLQPAYVQTLTSYNKVLRQKNKILQDAAERGIRLEEVAELLFPWNDQLVSLATRIHSARINYVGLLGAQLEHTLFEPCEVQLRYRSSLDGKGDLNHYEAVLAERLGLRLPAEVAAGHSLLGVHRDELEILFRGREMRVFGSSGQQRSALLLLDLAAISLYNLEHRDYPIFVIDDVDAELDENRITQLLDYLDGRTQTFITTSKRNQVESFLSRAGVYEIQNGSVLSQQPLTSNCVMAAGAGEGD
ncbi:MAG TPA: DNA replication and repair protein RecF [Pyrinomonadaceae bacterium]|nr:DNA replication and repair protein RecF [Pyrinomonadaceae bacterium]